MMDDNWYGTNLVTGNTLTGFGDVITSQFWHFFNWGGRVITHGFLQLTLMGGELFCDILNIIMTLLLTRMICVLADCKSCYAFFTAATLLISLNANIKMSMFWQSGTANYVYATTWILVFLWVYIRQVQTPNASALPLVNLWMPLLGLITGWSNENMGPASFLLSVAAILYVTKYSQKKAPLWMISGSVFCLLGSCLVILAPGNFVRSSRLPETDLGTTIYERLLSMLCAGTDFLFPTALLLTLLILLYTIIFRERLQPAHWMLLAHAILSYGAMVLSPHYPDRATFGTMVVCIVLMLFIITDMLQKHSEWKQCFSLLTGSLWLYAMYSLLKEIYITIPM
ncbi:MAG: hypothetical protein IJ379_03330 [Lachnospiraceae bacterium]|nr:hypothetical protein [Lachnospiraceae bacterium]